jgi:hypothetical protein
MRYRPRASNGSKLFGTVHRMYSLDAHGHIFANCDDVGDLIAVGIFIGLC